MKAVSVKSKRFRVAIETELAAVEKGCSARKITAGDILEALCSIEEQLSIAKAKLDGTSVTADVHAQHFPNAYHGIPESTVFTAVNRRGVWYVTGVYRRQTHAPTRAVHLRLSDTAKAALLDRFSAMPL